MRNFSRGGYKGNNSSNFSRNDRRNDRDSYRSNDNTYKRPADKGFNRSFSDNKKPRRDYDNNQPRSSFNQDRRDNHGGNRYGGNDRSFQDRSFRDTKYRNHTPPRNRDFDGHSESRFNRSSPTRFRQRTPPPSTSSFRPRNDFKQTMRPRPTRGGMSVRRGGVRPTGGRILNRNDLRSGLIAKRSAPIIRSKEYIKKIKQARLKLSEASNRTRDDDDDDDDDEPKTPPKEDDKDSKHEDDEDFLDVANDVNFEEDDEDAASKGLVDAKNDDSKATKDDKEEKTETTDKTSSDKANTSGTSTSDKEKSRRERSEKSPSKEHERSNAIDLNCVHCLTKCSTVNDFRSHLTRRSHMMAMKKVSLRARLTLNRLRKVQRDRQLDIEARLKNVENIPSKYCQICKLYFRQSKMEHRDSEDHKKIRNFLKPYCKICRVQLLSAMKYEIHRCTVEHLRRKAKKHETSDDEIDLHELDLGEFKTVDSVGDVDGEEVESALEDDEFNSKETSVGTEFVNKIEVNYCSLCREYLSRSSNDEKVIGDHCKSKKHLKWYYQSKKKDEKISAMKEKKAEEAAETAKEDVTSTSVQEGEKSSKKASDKEEKSTEISKETEKVEEKGEEKENAETESSTKFTRYFDQPQEN